jgi:hypothetical protein
VYDFGNVSTTKNLIYDFFIFNNEFDMLEIRLYELYEYVTLFLIAESNQTFTGKSKPLHLKKIGHVMLDITIRCVVLKLIL